MTVIVENALDEEYEALKDRVQVLRSQCQVWLDRLANNDVNTNQVLQVYETMGEAKGVVDAAAALTGITAHAQTVEDDVTYNVVTELNALSTAIGGALTWLETNFPNNGTYILAYSISGGTVTPRTFTPTQTAGWRTEISAIEAAIQAAA